MAMATTTDRSAIPTLDELELIKVNETALQNIGTKVASVISGIAASVLALVGLTSDDIADQSKGIVLLAAGIIIATGILAWAIVSAADIRARGEAAAANLTLRRLPMWTTVSAPAGAPGVAAGLWVHIRGRESSDKHLVVSSRMANGTNEFLLARNDETPTWHPVDQLDSWEVKASNNSVPA